jgi:hypothetical protein
MWPKRTAGASGYSQAQESGAEPARARASASARTNVTRTGANFTRADSAGTSEHVHAG